MRRFFLLAAALLCPLLASAELSVTVSPVKVAGQKAIVPLGMKNGLAEKIESARAVCFLTDAQGKVVGQATRWVIGGQAGPAPDVGLRPGATNTFHFVITSAKPLGTTILTGKVAFIRVILEGGRPVDLMKSVVTQEP